MRHGHARKVTVRLSDTDGTRLRVSDDGGGLDVSGPRSNTSYGLIGMQERAESLGGEFRLDSEPGRGTSVEVLLQ